jgi:hypothetical protein
MQEWLPVDIHDIHVNAIIELNIVTEGKPESSW